MSIKVFLAHHFRCMLTRISPELNTKVTYWMKFHKILDLENPKTLNEKILWLKFHTYLNDPLVKQCADKYEVRKYIESIGCPEILNELLDDFSNPEALNINKLPEKFVLKMNIGCGFNYIVFDKKDITESKLKKKMYLWLKQAPKNYLGYAEMQYKNVKPHFIVEKFINNSNGTLPEDYKFYCLNGKSQLIMYCSGRDIHGHGAQFYYLDNQWNMKANDANDSSIIIERPENLDKAIEYAEKLAKPFPFVRVDLYICDGNIIFGEMTFTPAAGMDIDHKMEVIGTGEDIDHALGQMLVLPEHN